MAANCLLNNDLRTDADVHTWVSKGGTVEDIKRWYSAGKVTAALIAEVYKVPSKVKK